jgi:threonine dehydrogenase-like Zn-dependent dehydrogenase
MPASSQQKKSSTRQLLNVGVDVTGPSQSRWAPSLRDIVFEHFRKICRDLASFTPPAVTHALTICSVVHGDREPAEESVFMQVRTIGIIGAGTMGRGIAQAAATKGFDVTLIDVSDAAVRKGIDAVESRLARLVAKSKMSAAEKDAALKRIRGTAAYEVVKPADVVIEAATENYDLKVKILKQIDPLVRTEGSSHRILRRFP